MGDADTAHLPPITRGRTIGNPSCINLLRTIAARELIKPAATGAEAGARLQSAITVDDVDARCTELATRGVKLLTPNSDMANGGATSAWNSGRSDARTSAGKIGCSSITRF